MPKRRSLVGTAREAIGAPPAEPPKASLAKRSRPAPKAPRAAEPAAAPPAPANTPGSGRAAAESPATAYEAMMSFASATLRQNIETGARLAQCKTPMEALAAQTAHAAAITQSFIAASLKLMQFGLSGVRWPPQRPPTDPH